MAATEDFKARNSNLLYRETLKMYKDHVNNNLVKGQGMTIKNCLEIKGVKYEPLKSTLDGVTR